MLAATSAAAFCTSACEVSSSTLPTRIELRQALVCAPGLVGGVLAGMGLVQLGLLQAAIELHQQLVLLERAALGHGQALHLGADLGRQRGVLPGRELGANVARLQRAAWRRRGDGRQRRCGLRLRRCLHLRLRRCRRDVGQSQGPGQADQAGQAGSAPRGVLENHGSFPLSHCDRPRATAAVSSGSGMASEPSIVGSNPSVACRRAAAACMLDRAW